MEKNKRDKKDKNKRDIDEAREELEKMIKQAEDQFGVDRNQIKVVKIKLPGRSFKYIFFDALISLLLNIILILSLSGYIIWTKASLLNILFFAIAYSLIEIILKNILNVFFVKLIIKTFGLIMIIPSIVAIPLVLVFTNFVGVTSNTKFLLMFVGVIFIRSIFRNIFNRYKKGY